MFDNYDKWKILTNKVKIRLDPIQNSKNKAVSGQTDDIGQIHAGKISKSSVILGIVGFIFYEIATILELNFLFFYDSEMAIPFTPYYSMLPSLLGFLFNITAIIVGLIGIYLDGKNKLAQIGISFGLFSWIVAYIIHFSFYHYFLSVMV